MTHRGGARNRPRESRDGYGSRENGHFLTERKEDSTLTNTEFTIRTNIRNSNVTKKTLRTFKT